MKDKMVINLKRTCLFLVCLALLLGSIAVIAFSPINAKADVSSPTERYSEDFSTAGNLPDGWVNLTPANGTATVSDGRLKMLSTVNAGGNASQNLMLQLPISAGGLKNFTYEIKFSIKRSTDNNTSRYMGFMLRMTGANESLPQYWHMAVRQKPSADSGVEFGSHGTYSPDKWNIVARGKYNEPDLATNGCLSPDTLYTAKIEVNGRHVSTYLNNKKMTNCEMPSDSYAGSLGLQICNLETEVDSVVVTEMPAGVNISTFATEYSYNTSLICPPVVATNVDTKEKLAEIVKNISALRPQIAILKVNDSGNVVDSASASMGELKSVVNSLVPKPTRPNPNPSLAVIPAFYASSEAAANKIVEFCQNEGISDAFVMSSDFNIVKSMRTTLTGLRGILDCTAYDISDTAGLIKVRDETNISNSRVAIIPKTATREQIDFLQSRLITVWTSEVANNTELATCVSRGSTGILTADYGSAYQFLKSFTSSSRASMPYIAAHRGNTYGEPDAASKTFPANSIEAAREAYKFGADTIESDIYITTDNKIVIGHDPQLGAFGEMNDNGDAPQTPVTGNPMLENMTLNQIKTKYFLRGGKCRIPTLEEYFEEFKKDKTTIHFVEIKSFKNNAVQLLKDLAVKCDVLDQLVVIIFKNHEAQLTQLREIMPEVSVGYLTQDHAWDGVIDTVSTIVGQTAPYNATYNPFYKMLTKSLAAQLLRRGITTWEWTSDENQLADHFNFGYSGITTNYAYQAADLIVKVTAPATLKVGSTSATAADASVVLTANTAQAEPNKKADSFIVVQGDSKLTLSDDGKLFGSAVSDTNNQVVVLLGYTYNNTKTKLSYTIYSDPVTVTIAKEQTPPDPVDPVPDPDPIKPQPTPPEKGCLSQVGGMGGMCGILASIIGICALVVVRGKKDNKFFKEEKTK